MDGTITTEATANDPSEIEVLQRHFYYLPSSRDKQFGLNFEGHWRHRTTKKTSSSTTGRNWPKTSASAGTSTASGCTTRLLGGLRGVDPIADEFAWVTTYNYAENRVPGGVDHNTFLRGSFRVSDPNISNENLRRLENSAREAHARGTLSFLMLTDVNDAAVLDTAILGNPMHLDGNPASTDDVYASYRAACWF